MAEVVSVKLHTNKKCPVLGVLFGLFLLFCLFLFNFPPPFKKVPMDRDCSPAQPDYSTALNVSRVQGDLVETEDHVIYHPGTYWKVDDRTYRGCPCSTKSVCIRKCCGSEEVFKTINGTFTCVRSKLSDSDFFKKSLKFYKRSPMLHRLRQIKNHVQIAVLPVCKHFGVLDITFLNTRKFLLEDGRIWDKYYNEIIDQASYCLETLQEGQERVVYAVCRGTREDLDLELHRRFRHRFIRNTIRALSLVLYLVSFLVFAAQPSIRQGYGRWLMCYLAARFLNSIQIVNFFNLNLKYPSFCVFTVMILQFSELSSQAWQIIIFYHIWLALRPDDGGPLGPPCSHNHKRFMFFCAVAWGLPFLVVSFSTIMQHFFTDRDIVLKFCWYNNRAAKTFLMSTPHVVTDLVILALCVDILRLMREYKRDAATLPANNIRHFNAKEIQWSCIYVEVSIVVAANYLLMSVLLFVDVFYVHVPNFLYYTVESIETMRGVDIFFIFVCHRSLLYLLRRSADNSFRYMMTHIRSLRRDIPLQLLNPQEESRPATINRRASRTDDPDI